MKTLYVVHGWGGSPKADWLPWLKKETEGRDWRVIIPEMPETNSPSIGQWTNHLQKIIKCLDKDTYLVGHSIGCQAIMRYLETQEKPRVGGIVFAAGWFSLQNLEGPEEVKIAKPWLETPIDFSKTMQATKNITAIFSDNDYLVPFKENVRWFKKRLGAKIMVERKKGHMTAEDGVKKLPSVLKALGLT